MKQISVEATPGKLEDEITAALKAADGGRASENEQIQAAAKAALDLAGLVSKRERVLVTIGGHDRPDGEGFNARHITLTISRIDPQAAS